MFFIVFLLNKTRNASDTETIAKILNVLYLLFVKSLSEKSKQTFLDREYNSLY